MKYISLFSGIEAASVAWEPLGWEPVAFAEIEPFCCKLLEKRFPGVPNLGDVSEIDWSPYHGSVDLIVGGSPCQAFSVAGKRKGMLDQRGKLMLEYVRAVREVRPEWLLWENVPGVLSQDRGLAFKTLLDELEQCGYSLAWRICDAQFYRVAQRRRRVFLVGNSSAGRAAAVLFEPESLCWDSPSSRDKRQALAANVEEGPGQSYTVVTRCGSPGGGKGALVSEDVSLTLSTLNEQTLFAPTYALQTSHTGANGSNISQDVAPTLDCASPGAVAFAQNTRNEVRVINGDGDIAGALAAQLGAKQQTYVCLPDKTEGCLTPWDVQSKRVYSSESPSPTLCTQEGRGAQPPIIVEPEYTVRRLTPTECERLQGFPDDWTKLDDDTADAPRYKALGNSMAVPVMRWIGQRIDDVNKIAR